MQRATYGGAASVVIIRLTQERGKNMRRALKVSMLVGLAALSVGAALATDRFTWKEFDLFVKRHLYVGSHILSGKPADGAANSFYVLPTIAAGTGAGTSPTVSISGTDLSGVISVTTGSTPATSATVATITYGTAYPTNSFVLLEPANAATAALAVASQVYPVGSTTNFLLKSNGTALTGATAYQWNYHILGN